MHPIWRSLRRRCAGAACLSLGMAGSLACTAGEPSAPEEQNRPAEREAGVTVQHDEYAQIARQLPGFAGLFLDQNELVVLTVDQPDAAIVRKATQAFAHIRGIGQLPVRLARAKYTFEKLRTERDRLAGTLEIPQLTVSSIDEVANRIHIGVATPAARTALQSQLKQAGFPSDLVSISVEPPFKPATTLQQAFYNIGGHIFRTGGLRVQFFKTGFGVATCTLGFNALVRQQYRGFITNSHCTNRRGVVNGDAFHQPSYTTGSTEIGWEVIDPGFFSGGACRYPGKICRFSDAAVIAYDSEATSGRGHIAKPTTRTTITPGSIQINPSDSVFRVIGTRLPLNLMVVEKVGSQSGWTGGTVVNVCSDHVVAKTGQPTVPSDTVLLCQMTVNGSLALDGDSGSPVFQIASGNQVRLLGLLWGSRTLNGVPQYSASPMPEVELDVGPFSNLTVP
jgi:hypothetical protein